MSSTTKSRSRRAGRPNAERKPQSDAAECLESAAAIPEGVVDAEVGRLPEILATVRRLSALLPNSPLSLQIGFQFGDEFRLEVVLQNGGKFVYGATDSAEE